MPDRTHKRWNIEVIEWENGHVSANATWGPDGDEVYVSADDLFGLYDALADVFALASGDACINPNNCCGGWC